MEINHDLNIDGNNCDYDFCCNSPALLHPKMPF